MITWAAIRLFASGALDGLRRGISAAVKWLLSDWRNFAVTLLAGLYVFANFVHVPRLKADLAASEQLVTDTQLAHLGTIFNYIDASAQAQADAEANVIRVRLDQEEITDATVSRYRSDRDALRARFANLRIDRLRAAGAAAGDPRRADPAGLPGASDAAGGAAAPTGEDRLPPAGVIGGSLSLDDALIASEQALQLGALIDWVEAQAAVRFTPANPDKKGER